MKEIIMNTNETPHLRSRRPSIQTPLAVTFFTPEEIIEHNVLAKALARSPEPKTFEEYKKWLAGYRTVIKRMASVRRELTIAHRNWKLAGGYGRRQENCAFPMTGDIEQAYAKASATFKAHEFNRYEQDMIASRTVWRTLGKTLWEANSKKD